MGTSYRDALEDGGRKARKVARVGKIVDSELINVLGAEGRRIVKITLNNREYEWFMVLVIRHDGSGEEYVCFHTGETLATLLSSYVRKFNSGAVRWQPNKKWPKDE